MSAGARTFGILVGGGPAPGINSAIAAATIEAANEGCRVLGLYDGFKWLARGDTAHAVELTIGEVSRMHWTAGTLLRTSRANPAENPESLARTQDALRSLGVTDLVCIGGDGTAFSAARVAQAAAGTIRVAVVPKTIDNDLPLPDGMPTFGYESARRAGATIVQSLMEDASASMRWYLVVSMGRSTGWLALGICKAAGATLAVIPEEFKQAPVSLESIADIVIGAMIKRRRNGHDHGVAIVAEGVIERIEEQALAGRDQLPRDQFGRIRMSEVEVGEVLRDVIRRRLADLKLDVRVIAKDVGYELRGARPVAYDIEYTRTLGYGAVRYLMGGGSGALIALRGGKVTPLELQTLIDPASGRVRTRSVDTETDSYEVGRKYMIRLEKSDFEQPSVGELAATAGMPVEEFKRRFGPV